MQISGDSPPHPHQQIQMHPWGLMSPSHANAAVAPSLPVQHRHLHPFGFSTLNSWLKACSLAPGLSLSMAHAAEPPTTCSTFPKTPDSPKGSLTPSQPHLTHSCQHVLASRSFEAALSRAQDKKQGSALSPTRPPHVGLHWPGFRPVS